jgi:GR25 family glycosyltransferase involved in LPS biosynthesis
LDLLKIDKRTINLDSAKDKWEKHTRLCRDAQIHDIQRFSAVDGSKYDMMGPYIQNMFLFTENFIGSNKNTPGIVGCALSHYALWQEVVKNGRPMLIMEDDITFCPRFVDRMSYLLQTLTEEQSDKPWHIVFVGFHDHETNRETHGLPRTYLTDKFKPWEIAHYSDLSKYGTRADSSGLHGGGTFGYLISPVGAAKMIDTISRCRFYFPVDYQFLDFGLNYKLDIRVCPHRLILSPKFGVDTHESSIQMTETK